MKPNMFSRTFVLTGAVTLMASTMLTAPAIAQEVVPASPSVQAQTQRLFVPTDFAEYAPRTALDMVNRIPGFSLEGGNDQGRGLGQGGANLLINGARVSGKSQGPRDTLSRIPADQVIRIEIVEGATLNIPGLAGDVANVIVKTGTTSGSWDWRGRFRPRARGALGNGDVSISGKAFGFDATASVTARADSVFGDGPEEFIDASGVVFESAFEEFDRQFQDVEVNLSLSREFANGGVLNLNGEFGTFNFNLTEASFRDALTTRGSSDDTYFLSYEDEEEGELSADYAFPLGVGTLKLIGVYGWEHSPTRSQFEVFSDTTGLVGGSRFDRVADEAELIGRAEYGWIPTDGRSWQLAVETVYNSLDLDSALFSAGSDGNYAPVTLDDPSAKVEEFRSEITLTHNRDITDKLSIQGSLGVEYSELSQSGAQNRTREFVRPKGFLNTTYKYSDSLDLRLEVARRVGQLDFFDFIDSLDLQLDQDNFGNADLVPVQFWNFAVEAEKDFGQGNTVLLRLFYEDIEDIVDRIPLTDGGDAVGNLDSAMAYGAIIESTIKGEKFGIDGLEINLEYIIQLHEVEDPLTFETRRINGRNNSNIEVDFRYDIPNTDWALGGGFEKEREAPNVRITEISQFDFNEPFSNLFIQHKDVYGMTATFTLANVRDVKERFRRDIWEGRRNETPFDRIEQRERQFGTFVQIGLSGTF